MSGTLFVVATPIGNLEDITLRALRVLREAAVIAAEDTRRTAILLQRHAISTPTVSLHEHNERQRTPGLLRRLQAGEDIALVSDAGTPLISDPGARLVDAALEAGLRVEPIPGPSAVATALAASGLPADRFTFLGFAPARAGERQRWLAAVRDVPGLLVYFEAPHRVRDSLRDLASILGNRQIVLGRELTKAHESIVRGWAAELAETAIPQRGEFTILVSDRKRSASKDSDPTDATVLVADFRQMTENGEVSSRDAVASIASRHAMPRQDVYAVLRRAGEIG